MRKRKGICSGQNLTLAKIKTRVQWQEYRETLRIPIPKSQSRLNLTVALNHSSEAILSSKDISRPTACSHTITQSRLDSRPNVPPRDDLIHNHERIEANLFESRKLLRDSFLIQSHLITQQIVEDSSRSPFQHTSPNYLDTLSAVTRIN